MSVRLKVLVVENSEDDTLLLVQELRRSGRDVFWKRVETAEQMRASLERQQWDLVVSDYSMPHFSAPAALELLRETGLDLPFIIVSGTVGEDVAVESMKAGAHDYFLKGNYTRLAPAIERELEQAAQRKGRRKAEGSSQTLLRAVEEAENVIFMADPEGVITYVNPAFEKLYGFSKAEALGKTPRILKSGRHDQAFYERFWQRLIAGESVREELVNKRRDGGLVTLDTSVSPVLNAQGGRPSFIAVQHDITERKRAEEALQREKLFSDTVITSLPGIFYLFDSKGRFLRWNENFERVSGYSGEEIGRMSPLDFFAGEEKRLIAERIEEAFVRGEVTAEASLVSKSGLAVPFFFTGRRMQAGEETFLVGMGIDGAALRALEQRYQVLMENAADAIFIISPDGAILEANRAAGRLRGCAREELIGLTIPDLLPAEEQAAVQQHFRQMLAGGSTRDEKRHILRADGKKVPIEVSVSPVEIGRDRVVIAIVRDVSERTLLEGQLRQAQKMEAVGQLAGGVAHDFNNLLTAILGYADLLEKEVGEESRLSEPIGEIRRAGERAASLTRQLLAFSRRQVLEAKVLDVNSLVENVERMLRRLIGEDVELVTALDPDIGRVRADAGQIEQVIMNLVVNARDAMPKGGKLTIETKDVELDEAYAREHAVAGPSGSYVMLAVSDSGTGMSAETQSRLFEPFFTTKEQGKGTGLGLSTLYGIVKQSGGYVWVYSELGRGTTFKIYLPRVEEKQEAPHRPAPALAEIVSGSETILLVEDEEAVRQLVRRVLEGKGYTVLVASGWEAALEVAGRHPKPIDLVVTDVVMPGVGGPELASRLEAVRPGIRVLFMSGYTDGAVVNHGLLSSATAFLQKPFTPDVLLRKVREVLSSQG